MDYFSHKTLRYTDKTVKMIKTDTKEVIPVIERAISARLRTTPRATSAVLTRQHSRLHSSPHFPRSHEVAYRNPQDSQASLQILVKKKKKKKKSEVAGRCSFHCRRSLSLSPLHQPDRGTCVDTVHGPNAPDSYVSNPLRSPLRHKPPPAENTHRKPKEYLTLHTIHGSFSISSDMHFIIALAWNPVP